MVLLFVVVFAFSAADAPELEGPLYYKNIGQHGLIVRPENIFLKGRFFIQFVKAPQF
jgi:hypothetical protein